jgi:hypothetical protein
MSSSSNTANIVDRGNIFCFRLLLPREKINAYRILVGKPEAKRPF